MKHIFNPPSPWAGFLKTPYYIFIQYLLVRLNILGQEQLMGHFTH